MFDILFLLIVALFIVSRLWSILGQDTFTPRRHQEGEAVSLEPHEVKISKKKHKKADSTTVQAESFFPGYDESDFLEGVHAAFTMILRAVKEEDLSVLRALILPALIERVKNFLLKKEHVHLRSCEVLHKELDDPMAKISVKFVVTDATGHHEESFLWVFERNIASRDPTWRVVELKDSEVF